MQSHIRGAQFATILCDEACRLSLVPELIPHSGSTSPFPLSFLVHVVGSDPVVREELLLENLLLRRHFFNLYQLVQTMN